MNFDDDSGEFSRLHSLFTFHLGIAVTLSWMTSLYAALYAPWVRNIRPLIDPDHVGHGREHLVLSVHLPGRAQRRPG